MGQRLFGFTIKGRMSLCITSQAGFDRMTRLHIHLLMYILLCVAGGFAAVARLKSCHISKMNHDLCLLFHALELIVVIRCHCPHKVHLLTVLRADFIVAFLCLLTVLMKS